MKLSVLKNNEINFKKISQSFFVFDIETTKLEPLPKNFVFGVIYGYKFKKIIKSVECFKKEFKLKKYKGKTIFAHNAEFDLLGIYGNIFKNLDTKAIFNGKFIMAKSNGVTFADSLNILLASVQKVGEKLGFKKINNEKIKKGGLTKSNMNSQDIEYCTRDCEIVYNALLPIFKEIGRVAITISSISLIDFRRNYLKHDINFNELVYEFYDSYYGGRTEAFKIGYINKAKVYDINSLYPSVMVDNFYPDPSKLIRQEKISIKEFSELLETKEGMVNLTINHIDTTFGVLPFRFDGKLLFPVGQFTSTWNFNEIRYAISIGYIAVLKVNYVISAEPMVSPFNDFIKELYNLRNSSKNEMNKYFIKIRMNSLYGRLGMRKKYSHEYFENFPEKLIDELQRMNKYYKLNIFSIEREDCILETENKNPKNSFFAIPSFASYITSYARIELMKSLIANENNGVVYCDTDSIFLEGKFEGEINDNLGGWKKEDKKVIEIRGLKNYSFISEQGICEVIKGISKRAKKENGVYYTLKYYKTKQALRNNKIAGENFIEKKELRHVYNKRIVDKYGNTKPIKF